MGDNWVYCEPGCPQQSSCARLDDGTNSDPCNQQPCSWCGAICPNSTWTPDAALGELRYHEDRLRQERVRVRQLIELHRRWRERR